ncbi:MAG: hypothetical protein AAGA11_00700 [Pseudomonadota bacterium]
MTASRYTVVGAHLLLSAALLGGLLVVMLTLWYPAGLFGVAGGWQGLRILAPIDLVLGPLLTLMFYRPGKRGVVRDLAVIGCVQIAALSYGLFAVYQQRPVAIVFAEGEFIAVTPADRDEANAALRARDYRPVDPRTLSEATPPLVVARPVPPDEYGSYITSLFNDMPELAMRADRYEPLAVHRTLLDKHAVDGGEASGTDAWFRLKTKFGTGRIRIDLSHGGVIASHRDTAASEPRAQALHQGSDKRDDHHTTNN